MDFIVGTFNTSDLFILHFSPATASKSASITIVRSLPAIGSHSWLALSEPRVDTRKRLLYATTWTEPPSIAAYAVNPTTRDIQFVNAKPVKARPGYVCVSGTHVYSVGGPTGEAFTLLPDGGIGDLVQELSFVDDTSTSARAAVPHGDFGGLRHGSHSVDLSPDRRSLYVADIGRNAIFTYSINKTRGGTPHLTLGSKHVSPRSNDGPRHTWPHPNGQILYSLQEHSSMVDLFNIAVDGTTLTHLGGVKIIPEDKDPVNYWADEVRLSTTTADEREAQPRYLYASTRGLHKDTMGYVAVFELNPDGSLQSDTAVCIWETPTSGGIANAIEPAPRSRASGLEYLAMTDSEQGWVFILAFDGTSISETARVKLGQAEDGQGIQAATAVWL
ncbi:hypothetical protein AMS68_006532 [Peltaster fructicola]|uniref:Muconate cycloisomerase 1 n=1 Tax=Peltaster fructicola TaxID=286661 RepID=A0A6H0Y271_9PEZI|nr:hypothetical protein AMS68_006532 [Peltaster fructicola]